MPRAKYRNQRGFLIPFLIATALRSTFCFRSTNRTVKIESNDSDGLVSSIVKSNGEQGQLNSAYAKTLDQNMSWRNEVEGGENEGSSVPGEYVVKYSNYGSAPGDLIKNDPQKYGVPIYSENLEDLITGKPTEEGRIWPGDVVLRMSQNIYFGHRRGIHLGTFKVIKAKVDSVAGTIGVVNLNALNMHWKIGDRVQCESEGDWHEGVITKLQTGTTLGNDGTYTVLTDKDGKHTRADKIRAIVKEEAKGVCGEYKCPRHSVRQNLDSTSLDEATCCQALNPGDRVAVEAEYLYVWSGEDAALTQHGETGTVKKLSDGKVLVTWDHKPVQRDEAHQDMWVIDLTRLRREWVS